MKTLRNILSALTSFSRDERWAIIILAATTLIIVSIRISTQSSLGRVISVATDTKQDTLPRAKKDTLFNFNPNTISTEDLQLLGFSKKQAIAIDNYRKAGAIFKSADDFGRSFVVSDSMLKRVAPYMQFPEIKPKPKPTASKVDKTDINTADSAALCSVKGIGPIISKRIIKYRNRLGGFISIHQLNEVYGLSEEIINQIDEIFFADTAEIQKIDINFASEKILRKHPYMNSHTADRVLKIREMKGGWNNIAEMKNDETLLPNEARLLEPYLLFRPTKRDTNPNRPLN